MTLQASSADGGSRRHNRAMRRLAFCLVLLAATAGVHADVLRCTDAAGKVSYTDQAACPVGSKPTGNVPVPEAAPPGYAPSGRAAQDGECAAFREQALDEPTSQKTGAAGHESRRVFRHPTSTDKRRRARKPRSLGD